MKVGIPEELMCFPWLGFMANQLQEHGDITILTSPTKKHDSIMLSEGDACQPFKSMVRTAIGLLPEVDVLFVPRLVELDGHLMCPNFRALPDIVALNIKKNSPELTHKLYDEIIELKTNNDSKQVISKIIKHIFDTDISIELIQKEPQEDSVLDSPPTTYPDKTIALLGHPYLLEDPKLNMGIINQLERAGYNVVTPIDIPFADLDELAKLGDYYAKTNYWRSSRETLGAYHYFTKINRPAGIIYLISFNCGVDALMRIELTSMQSKDDSPLPFMVLVGDEHTQQEHTATRLEAYLDIIDGN